MLQDGDLRLGVNSLKRLLESYKNFTGNFIKDIEKDFYLGTKIAHRLSTVDTEEIFRRELNDSFMSELLNFSENNILSSVFLSFEDAYTHPRFRNNNKWLYPDYIKEAYTVGIRDDDKKTILYNEILVGVDFKKLMSAYSTYNEKYIKDFFEILDTVFSHELTHSYQNNKQKEELENIDTDDTIKYLSQKEEIAARCMGSIHELLQDGFKPRVILAMIKDKDLFEETVVKQTTQLKPYYYRKLLKNEKIKNYIYKILLNIINNFIEIL